MNVLIVAKTRMRNGACVGGLLLHNNGGLRLLQSDGANQPRDTEYEVGQIWDIEYTRPHSVRAPHTEDIYVTETRLVDTVPSGAMHDFLAKRVQIWRGGPEKLFVNLVGFTGQKSGFISEDTGIPDRSTGFWISDQDLVWNQKETRFEYNEQHRKYRFTKLSIPYVGFAPVINPIPLGSLLRVSLARWWRPDDAPDMEKRCYLQLSGWYLPD